MELVKGGQLVKGGSVIVAIDRKRKDKENTQSFGPRIE